MDVQDASLPLEQRDLLQLASVPCRVIGQDLAEANTGDDNIVGFLHHLKQPTFLTRDQHFFRGQLGHPSYALVDLDVVAELSKPKGANRL